MDSEDAKNIDNTIESLLKFRDLPDSERFLEVLKHLKSLRNICANGTEYQDYSCANQKLHAFLMEFIFPNDNSDINKLFSTEDLRKLQLLAWQYLGNLTVKNVNAQQFLWERYGEIILQNWENPPIDIIKDIQLMIMYNIFISKTGILSLEQALKAVVVVWHAIINHKSEDDFEYLHFFFEHLLVQDGRTTVRYYAHLKPHERVAFLDYLANYMRHDSPNGPVHIFLLQYLAKELKVKSDAILCQTAAEPVNDNPIKPREAYLLLRCVAGASGSDLYAHAFTSDHSLFLNVSSLLRCIVAAGKEINKNIFTPMQKLQEVAVKSKIAYDFEDEISFELKTLLVRCVANLLYKNPTNQKYCVETQVLSALFECTNMDARNPLIKEWAILAIRNACVDCPAAQEVVANLSKQGDAPNDVMSELDLEMGALRIQPTRE